ncbi:hypothetical protein M5D96_000187 [Drosophila gunungcola]|uniref:Uncharacterized protein n=1 Tax=Drosophila gunungcola TaxID=103775 RepID=A0A9P9YW97_9MUSC|nr:hypothetical protein M5D96_000187 [Drosophila gunungcola]
MRTSRIHASMSSRRTSGQLDDGPMVHIMPLRGNLRADAWNCSRDWRSSWEAKVPQSSRNFGGS